MRSCLQDAAIIAAKHIGVDMCKDYVYKRCTPRSTKDTTVSKIIKACFEKMNFIRETHLFAHAKGGKEYQLIKTVDERVRIVLAAVNNTLETTKHSFVHVAHPIPLEE